MNTPQKIEEAKAEHAKHLAALEAARTKLEEATATKQIEEEAYASAPSDDAYQRVERAMSAEARAKFDLGIAGRRAKASADVLAELERAIAETRLRELAAKLGPRALQRAITPSTEKLAKARRLALEAIAEIECAVQEQSAVAAECAAASAEIGTAPRAKPAGYTEATAFAVLTLSQQSPGELGAWLMACDSPEEARRVVLSMFGWDATRRAHFESAGLDDARAVELLFDGKLDDVVREHHDRGRALTEQRQREYAEREQRAAEERRKARRNDEPLRDGGFID